MLDLLLFIFIARLYIKSWNDQQEIELLKHKLKTVNGRLQRNKIT